MLVLNNVWGICATWAETLDDKLLDYYVGSMSLTNKIFLISFGLCKNVFVYVDSSKGKCVPSYDKSAALHYFQV